MLNNFFKTLCFQDQQCNWPDQQAFSSTVEPSGGAVQCHQDNNISQNPLVTAATLCRLDSIPLIMNGVELQIHKQET